MSALLLVSALLVAPFALAVATAGPAVADAPAGGEYVPLPDTQIYTTVGGTGIGTDATQSVTVLGVGGVPSTGVLAVAVNITEIDDTAGGYFVAYPAGQTKPTASTLDFPSGTEINNLAIIDAGSSGQISIYNQSAGSADYSVAVEGYVTAASEASPEATFFPLASQLVLDTRTGLTVPEAKLTAGGTITANLGGVGGIPTSGVAAVMLDMGTTNASANSYLTAWQSGTGMPTASTLQVTTGTAQQRTVVVPTTSTGSPSISIYNNTGTTDVFASIEGYFLSPSAGEGSTFVPITDTRIVDTSTGLGGTTGPLTNGQTFAASVTGSELGSIPTADVSSVLVNVTATATVGGYEIVYPNGATRPTTSTLDTNATYAEADLADIQVPSNGEVNVWTDSGTGTARVIMDVEGYFINTALTAPTGTVTTTQSTPLSAVGPNADPYLSYDYRVGTSGAFSLVPAANVTYADGSAVTWPVPLANGVFPTLTWAAETTLGSTSGTLQVEDCVAPTSTTTTSICSAPGTVTVVSSAPPTAPGTPTATAGSHQATVTWTAPGSNGGATISGYTVLARPGGQRVSTTGALSATVIGLTNGVASTFTVYATNNAGTGPASAASTAVTPSGVPGAPANVQAQPEDASALVTWSPPDSEGAAITGYTVTSSPGGLTATSTSTSATVTGLTSGTAYTFTVVATNADGTGAASIASTGSLIAGAYPDVPSAVHVVAGDRSITASWTAPTQWGNTSNEGYLITTSPPDAKANVAATATSTTISGLTNGVNYSVAVTAENAVGSSPASVTASTTPVRVLGTGQIGTGAVTTVLGNGTAATQAGTGTTTAELNAPVGMVIAGGYLYTATADAITKTLLSSGVTTILAGTPGTEGCSSPNLQAQTGEMVTDGTYLYVMDGFINPSSCGVRQINMTTGAISSTDVGLPGGYGSPSGLAVVAGTLYLTGGDSIFETNFSSSTATLVATYSPAYSGNFGGLSAEGSTLYMTFVSTAYTGADGFITYSLATNAFSSFVPVNSGDTYLEDITPGPVLADANYLYTVGDVPGDTSHGPILLQISMTSPYPVTAVAGADVSNSGGSTAGGIDATGADAWFGAIGGLTIDPSTGYLYVGDTINNTVRRVVSAAPLPASQPSSVNSAVTIINGTNSVIVGTGSPVTTAGTGAVWTTAGLNDPTGLVSIGNTMYVSVADAVTQVNMSTGQQSLLAGVINDQAVTDSPTGEGTHPALIANSGKPGSLVTDGHFLYVVNGTYLRRVSLTNGATSVIANDGTYFGALAVGPNGELYTFEGQGLVSIDPGTGLETPYTLPSIGSHCSLNSIAVDSQDLYYAGVCETGPSGIAYIADVSLANLNASAPLQATEFDSETQNYFSPVIAAIGSSIYYSDWSATGSDTSPTLYETPKSSLGSGEPVTVMAAADDISAITSDGSTIYVADGYNSARGGSSDLYAVVPSPPPANLGPLAEGPVGDRNDLSPSSNGPCGCAADPVDLDTGAYYSSSTDLSVAARGPGLSFTRNYNSVDAAVNGPLGYGWTDPYNMSLSQPTSGPDSGDVVITEETNSQVAFVPSGSSYLAAARVFATLTKNTTAGTWTFYRNQTRETFTFKISTGALTTISDANGNTTTLAYNSYGQLATASNGPNSLSFTYSSTSATAQILSVSDGLPQTVTYGYNSSGNLSSVTNSDGDKWSYGYTTTTPAAHLLTTVTDPRTNTTVTNVYTTSPSASSFYSPYPVQTQTDGRSYTTHFSYAWEPETGQDTTTVTDPDGDVNVWTYSDDELTSKTLGSGTAVAGTWTYTYDPLTRSQTSVTDPNGNTTRSYYDANGNLLTSVDPLDRETSYTYNNLNEPLTVTDPLGTTTTNSYDADGNLLSSSTPDVQTSQVATTLYHYDDPANPGMVTATTNGAGQTITTTYNSEGEAVTSSDGTGRTTDTGYDSVGRRISVTAPAGTVPGANPAAHTTAYANLTAYGSPQVVTDPLGHVTTYTYDADGNTLTTTDPNSIETVDTYDPDNDLATTTTATSVETYAYDDDDLLSEQTNALGHGWTYAYDAQKRLASGSDTPISPTRTTSYTYDGVGNLLSTSQPDTAGPIITYDSYDADNELACYSYTAPTSPGQCVTPAASYTYNADGERVTMVDATGTTNYTTDSLGRTTQIQDGAGATIGMAYDLDGDLTTLTYPTAQNVTYGYDSAGRMTSMQDWLSNTTTFGYDQDGNFQSQSDPNSTTIASTYDNADRLTSITDSKSGTAFASFAYTLSKGDTRTALTTSGTPQASQTYAYNTRDQLQTVTGGTDAGTYTVDAANRVTGLANGTTLGYDSADELQTLTPTTGTATSYTFNQRGDRTAATTGSAVVSYGYNQQNKLISYAAAGVTTTYANNGDQQRESATTAGVTTSYTWNDSDLLSDGTNSYLYGPDGEEVEQISSAGAPTFAYTDALHSVRALAGSTGTVTGTFAYTATGALASRTGSATSALGYSGALTDPTSQLVYLQARDYDPATAQFLTSDPLETATNMPYSYAGADPIDRTDPSGLDDQNGQGGGTVVCSISSGLSDSCESTAGLSTADAAAVIGTVEGDNLLTLAANQQHCQQARINAQTAKINAEAQYADTIVKENFADDKSDQESIHSVSSYASDYSPVGTAQAAAGCIAGATTGLVSAGLYNLDPNVAAVAAAVGCYFGEVSAATPSVTDDTPQGELETSGE